MTLPTYVAIDNSGVGYNDMTTCLVAVQAWITANSPTQLINVQFLYVGTKAAAVITFT